jgi:hypothetical protein
MWYPVARLSPKQRARVFFHHPVALTYLFLMTIYLALGALALAIGLVLAVWPRGQETGRRLAGGIFGSLPFLFFFQCLSLPVLVAVATIAFFLGIWSGPNMIAGMPALGLSLGVVVAHRLPAS